MVSHSFNSFKQITSASISAVTFWQCVITSPCQAGFESIKLLSLKAVSNCLRYFSRTSSTKLQLLVLPTYPEEYNPKCTSTPMKDCSGSFQVTRFPDWSMFFITSPPFLS